VGEDERIDVRWSYPDGVEHADVWQFTERAEMQASRSHFSPFSTACPLPVVMVCPLVRDMASAWTLDP